MSARVRLRFAPGAAPSSARERWASLSTSSPVSTMRLTSAAMSSSVLFTKYLPRATSHEGLAAVSMKAECQLHLPVHIA